MKNIASILILLMVFFSGIFGQTKMESTKNKISVTEEITKCLQHYFNASDNYDPAELSLAFYQGAIMFWVDEKGEIATFTQRRWKTALKENRKPVKAIKRDIQIIDCTQDICVAKIVSTFSDRVYNDYVALVKSNGM
jgi:hypothetical protein